MTAPHPWQDTQWQQLARERASGRLPHALLLAAPGGTGLEAFADRWSRALLCGSDDAAQRPCGHCPACEQLAAGTHPDRVSLEPEEAGKAIGIDAVRELVARLTLTAGARGKVAVIHPADSLTLAAANSLLKTLEEPPGDSIILLVCRRPSRLPATIRSRCRPVSFGLPSRALALEWLREQRIERPEYWLGRAGGAPLEAARLATAGDDADDLVRGLLDTLEQGRVPAGVLRQAAQQPLESSVPLFGAVVGDLLRIRIAGATDERLQHPGHREQLARVAQRLDARALFHYLDELNRAVPGPSSSLRPDMQVEGLLADAAGLQRRAQVQAGDG